jgi:hypothetical protein
MATLWNRVELEPLQATTSAEPEYQHLIYKLWNI